MHIVAPVVPVAALIVAPSTVHIVIPVIPVTAFIVAPSIMHIVAPVVPTVALSVTVGRSEHRLQQGEDTSLSLLR